MELTDSRNFGRTLAASGLVAGPLLFLLATLVDPAWAGDSAQNLQQVADGRTRYIAAGLMWTVGCLLFIAGTLGVVRLMRGRGVTLGQVGAALMTIGLILLSAAVAFYAIDLVLADFTDRQAAVALYDAIGQSPVTTAYYMISFLFGIVVGSLLLAIALLRRRIVPAWSPILLIASTLLGFFGNTQALTALSLLLLGAALFPLSMKVRSLTDEDWGRWEPLGGDIERTEPPTTTP